MSTTMRRDRAGFTLVEVLAASLVTAVVAGGTMMAFVTAARLAREGNSTGVAEATGFAQEVIEGLRNSVFAQSSLFDDANLNIWKAWPEPLPASGGSESILQGGAAKRCYRVTPEDCDGVAGEPDCYAVQVKVCWNGTPCPSGC